MREPPLPLLTYKGLVRVTPIYRKVTLLGDPGSRSVEEMIGGDIGHKCQLLLWLMLGGGKGLDGKEMRR